MISAAYQELLAEHTRTNPLWGGGGLRHRGAVMALIHRYGCRSALDYGCGRGTLGNTIMGRDKHHKRAPLDAWYDYEPSRGLWMLPDGADLVVCTHVLEHVEPEFLDVTLTELGRLARKVLYVAVPSGPAEAVLPDGRNAHLTQRPGEWWLEQLTRLGTVDAAVISPRESCFVLLK